MRFSVVFCTARIDISRQCWKRNFRLCFFATEAETNLRHMLGRKIWLDHSGIASPKVSGGGEIFDIWGITLFCLEKRLWKHKMTIFFKNWGGMAPLAPHWLRLCSIIIFVTLLPAVVSTLEELQQENKQVEVATKAATLLNSVQKFCTGSLYFSESKIFFSKFQPPLKDSCLRPCKNFDCFLFFVA